MLAGLRLFVCVFLSLLGGVFSTVASADDRTQTWQAVGRVDIGAQMFCTGTLIRPAVVLTAAHCFFDKTNGTRILSNSVAFHAGYAQGTSVASRRAARVVLHPDYVYLGDGEIGNVMHDLALIELEQAIDVSKIKAFATTSQASYDQSLNMVSYAKDRSERATVETSCAVLAQKPGVDVTSCSVNFGASGAPIFVREGGALRIASIVSAKGEWRGQRVSIATSVAQGLARLTSQFNVQKTAGLSGSSR